MPTFTPGSPKSFRLSRSKIELYMNCPHCFYLDRRLGVSQPSSPPFTLNNAVDALLKKEFDHYRASGTPHPLMKASGLKAVPFSHDKLEEWRDSLRRGIRYLDPSTNLEITGGVDDVWIGEDGKLIIADYKATSKNAPVTLDADWQISYKRQMEIYQWLFRKNGFQVSDTGYFVYANGDSGADSFNHCLKFDLTLIPYTGNDEWVQPVIHAIHECLLRDEPPQPREDCEWCEYRKKAVEAMKRDGQGSLF